MLTITEKIKPKPIIICFISKHRYCYFIFIIQCILCQYCVIILYLIEYCYELNQADNDAAEGEVAVIEKRTKNSSQLFKFATIKRINNL